MPVVSAASSPDCQPILREEEEDETQGGPPRSSTQTPRRAALVAALAVAVLVAGYRASQGRRAGTIGLRWSSSHGLLDGSTGVVRLSEDAGGATNASSNATTASPSSPGNETGTISTAGSAANASAGSETGTNSTAGSAANVSAGSETGTNSTAGSAANVSAGSDTTSLTSSSTTASSPANASGSVSGSAANASDVNGSAGNTTGRVCWDFPGVQLEESDNKTQVWEKCSAKWSEDCSNTGCCVDWGYKCFQKAPGWSACKEKCSNVDPTDNSNWTCWEVPVPKPRTAAACVESCKKNETCKEAVYSADAGGSCRHSPVMSSKVVWAADTINSSLCGNASEQKALQALNDKVWKQLPFQIELPLVNCSWGGEDCSQTKCCNDYMCDKDYNQCFGWSCWKKDQYFAGCAAKPDAGWDGTWIGGAREHRNIGPAGAQVALQGRSLYCFTVVCWNAPRPKPFWNSEGEIANNWKRHGLHVMQCDGWDILDGYETPKAEWGSFSNIDMFMSVWDQIKNIGKYKNHDWTVKVDADAVFIPSRLKDHLYNLRTPKGSRVYLENIWFKFKFMGAIEIMTLEATELFLKMGHTCIRGDHAGGEDSFLKGCLDGLGVDHQSDHAILRDRYAAMDGPCLDGWAVAYHYMKKMHDWSDCYNEVMCGTNYGCQYAIESPPAP